MGQEVSLISMIGTVHDLAPNKHDVDEQGRDEVIPLDKVGQAYL